MTSTTITLTNIAHGGEAIGHHQGKIVFVPHTIPGEIVEAEIVQDKPRWARARLVRVLTPSPDRVEPPCPYFGPGQCGGCQWQHVAYERQLALKAVVVTDQLRRLGGVDHPPVLDPIALADEEGLLAYGYRNHAQFLADNTGRLGFVRETAHNDDSAGDWSQLAQFGRSGSEKVIAVKDCLLLHAQLADLFRAVVDGLAGDAGEDLEPEESDEADSTQPPAVLRRVSLRAGVNTGQRMLIFETQNDRAPALAIEGWAVNCALKSRDGTVRPLVGQGWIEEQVAGRVYRVSANSFFQVNTVGAEVLVQLALEMLGLQGNETLLDGFCGVGLFGLSLADQVAQVIAIEESESACDDFAWNARDLDNVTLHEGPVADVLATFDPQPAIDAAIIDPPRSGAGPEVVRQLQRLRVPKLLYVACDPATLARDVRLLIDAGYRLEQVQPVDLFPQTYHVECLALLRLRG